MKKVLLPILLLMAISFMFAVESAPSAIVGYVKYPCVTTAGGLNMVALPMESGYVMASDVANAFPGMMDALNYWDAATQTWVGAYDLGGFFDGDFEVTNGLPLWINALGDFNFYSMGSLPAASPSYNLIPGLNMIMVPLNHSELAMASDVGMSIGTVDALNYWDAATQTWVGAYDLGGFYDGDYSVAIGMPLWVNSFDTVTWPGAKHSQTLKASRASK